MNYQKKSRVMNKNLQSFVKSQQPNSTESTIRQASKTKSKDTKVWIVVEGDDDADLYGKMYDNYFVQVLPSADKRGNKSCENVETIVANILADSIIKIIGIRDKDYTPFTGHTPPQNIYLTDRRDIEMQIMEVKIKQIIPHITPQSLADVFSFAKQVGYYRIFNAQESLGFRFDCIDANNYWDFSQKRLKIGWCASLESFFFSCIMQRHNIVRLKQKYDSLINRLNSGQPSKYDLCQGHEVVNLLKRTSTNHCLDQLEKDLFKWYNKADYVKTTLAQSIKKWACINACRM